MTQAASPRISVVIPTHEREDMLERAVRSASDQSHPPIEIIVVDDLGRHQTRSLCDSLNATLSLTVKYIENAGHGGAPASRNIGARDSQGELLAFLDDDDTWDKEYLFHAASIMSEQAVDVLVTGLMAVNESGEAREDQVAPSQYDERALYLTNPGVLCSNVVIVKSAFDQIGGYDVSVQGSCDKDLIMQAVRSGFVYGVNRERLVNWHVHESQWSNEDRRLLPSVLRFYRKYFFSMPPSTHVRMWKKMIRMRLGKYSRVKSSG